MDKQSAAGRPHGKLYELYELYKLYELYELYEFYKLTIHHSPIKLLFQSDIE